MGLYSAIEGAFFETAQFSYGLCAPDVCSFDDIDRSAKILFQDAGLDAEGITRPVSENNKRAEMDSYAISIL